jgi:hypothetical protein
MSPQVYKYVLVAANLAIFHTKWGFSIKNIKWKLFIEGHQFTASNCVCMFEVDTKKINLNTYINGVSPVHMVKLRCCLLPAFVIARCRATINTLVVSYF